MIPIELTVQEHPDSPLHYRIVWLDGDLFLGAIPECWLDLAPYMAARTLLEQGYNASRELIVRLQGADYELMRAPLGVVAAPPSLATSPVTQPTRCVYRERRHV